MSLARDMAAAACILVAALLTPATSAHGQSLPARPAPRVVFTDVASGPLSGGEHNKGAFLSIFGKHFGQPSGLGSSTRVFIGRHEVDNYRSLGRARGRPDLQQISVQVGALGNPKPGEKLAIEVVVDGVPSNTDVTFVANPGRIFFVSPAGDDAKGRPDDVAHPYRTVQRAGVNNSAADTPGCAPHDGDQPVAAAGVWGLVGPGDTIVMRGGRWTDIGRDAFFLRAQNKSGSAPTGAKGSGPIAIVGYPGEQVLIDRPNTLGDGQPGGGISSADTARQRLGCGAWITVANLSIETGLVDGPVNTQAAAVNPAGSHWRVVNNELTAAGCRLNSRCRAGGVAGSGRGNLWIGNHVHDIEDRPDCCTSLENHGFYVEGDGSYEIAYNLIERIGGGNGVQTFASVGPTPSVRDVDIHHNLIRDVAKHGINIADGSTAGIRIFANIVQRSAQAALRLNSGSLVGARVEHNTFVGTDLGQQGSPRAALMNDAVIRADAVTVRNNIIVPGRRERLFVGGSVGFDVASGALDHNLWFDGRGDIPARHKIVEDPGFVDELHLRAASPARRSGVPRGAPIQHDYDLNPSRDEGADMGALWSVR